MIQYQLGVDYGTRGSDLTVLLVVEYNAETKQMELVYGEERSHKPCEPFYAHERILSMKVEDEAWKDL